VALVELALLDKVASVCRGTDVPVEKGEVGVVRVGKEK
jgi:hypothetical protein